MKVWGELRDNGTDYVSSALVSGRINHLLYRWKTENIAGLQLADLVVSPIGRHVIGKPGNEDFVIVESKFRRNNGGGYQGYGLVVLP
jgi:hypothetical protein